MRRVLVPALLVAVLATGVGGCARTVAGAPSAAPPLAIAAPGAAASARGSVTAGSSAVGSTSPSTGGPVPASPPTSAASPQARPEGGDTGADALEPDVLTDECLLDAAQVTALLGLRVPPPTQAAVQRDDGSRSSSCYAGPADGAAPTAAINVYRLRTGTPAQFVHAAGGRALSRAGLAATVLDTPAGPTLQVAGPRLLVTIAVQGRDPDDDAWRRAARAALARLPG